MTGETGAAARPGTAAKFSEWHQQWSMFEDHVEFLFHDWIKPNTLETFRGKDVLEGGCGGGQHTAMVAPVAASITAVDLNTADIARERNHQFKHVTFVEGDLATMDLGRQFDVVFCIGVIHHTDDPDATFRNLYRHCRSGGRMIIWTYSAEGNTMVRYGVEPIRKLVLRHLSRKNLHVLSSLITPALYPLIYTVYRLPMLRFLPYYEYFANARRLSFARNVLYQSFLPGYIAPIYLVASLLGREPDVPMVNWTNFASFRLMTLAVSFTAYHIGRLNRLSLNISAAIAVILTILLAERMIFTARQDSGGSWYEFRGAAILGRLLTGMVLPKGMVAPTGFEPVFQP